MRLFIAAVFWFVLSLPAPAQVFNWTGFYAGLHGGYGDFYSSSPIADFRPEGGIIGVHVGYNWQHSPYIVLSAEVDFSKSGMSNYASWARYTSIEHLSSARLRAGFAIDRTLVFVSGGLAYAEVRGFPNPMLKSSGDIFGVVGSAGIERALAHRWSTRIEYLYYRFDISEISTDYLVQVGRIALNYRF